jgi:uncharacterized membrane protein YcaP (DUF421 family)
VRAAYIESDGMISVILYKGSSTASSPLKKNRRSGR